MNAATCPFPETADIETSSDEYAGRFAGACGQWMLEVQERLTLSLLAERPGAAVLDVGGGHGQLTIPLCREGYPVTILSSSDMCRKRVAGIISDGKARFQVGNLIDLPYPDKTFDVVMAFRLLTHCERWATLVTELCRTARHAVIVDYPTSQSINAIAPALFNAKKKLEKNTRTWTLFTHDQVAGEFQKNRWHLARRAPQFFLPMVLHRTLKSRTLSAGLESMCRRLGLTGRWGSPIIARFEPD